MWYDFVFNSMFWLVILAVAVFAYTLIKSTPLKKVPVINNRKTLIIVAIIGFVITSGIWASLGLGSFAANGGSVSASGVTISDVQITGLTGSTAGDTVTLDASNPYLIHLRGTDAQMNETSGINELNSSLFSITRTGDLKATSCLVTISSNDWSVNEVTGQQGSTPYNILEKDATGRYKTYFKSGSTQATTSDAQQQISIPFAEGVSTASFTVLSNVDEESSNALNQYSSRDAIINVCGFPIDLQVTRM